MRRGMCGGECEKGDEETVVMEKGKRGGNCGEDNKEGGVGDVRKRLRRGCCGKEDSGNGEEVGRRMRGGECEKRDEERVVWGRE